MTISKYRNDMSIDMEAGSYFLAKAEVKNAASYF